MKIDKVSPIRAKKVLFNPISFTIKYGNIVVLMGASGIGKSSLIEAISGSLDHTGKISQKTDHFIVFQDTEQLFPWMTILDNLKLSNAKTNWEEHLKTFKLSHKLQNYPNECSAGQKQRITLLRAIHSGKSVLLCDEPLSGVDKDTAFKICKEFKNYVKKTKKKVLWVTHDHKEAKLLGKVIVLK